MHQAGEVEACIVLALARENSQSVARPYVWYFTGSKPLGYVPATEVCVQSSLLSSVCRERLPALPESFCITAHAKHGEEFSTLRILQAACRL